MAQHDYDLENQTGFNFRADLNNALAAIATNNSGATAPTPTYPHQWWFDTVNDLLKIRNELNDAWVVVGKKVGNNFFTYAASGDAITPGITFNGNPNTGLFSPVTGVLGISSNGVERVRFSANGNINTVGSITQVPGVMSSFNIDCSTGNYFSKNGVGQNANFTFSNVPSNTVYSCTVAVFLDGNYTLTFPANWSNNIAPVVSSNKWHLFMFVTTDVGANWVGSYLTNYG